MRRTRLFAVLFTLLALAIAPAFASAEGWGMPNLNPFAAKAKTAGVNKTPTKFGKKEPSTLDKVSSGTAKAWKSTTGALTPWKTDKKTPVKPATMRNTSAKSGTQKSSWYNPTSWWGKKDTAPQVKTAGSVSEFLNQPRVDY